MPSLPLVQEIAYCDPVQCFAAFAEQDYALLLDSSRVVSDFGRYSFIAVDPFMTLRSKNGQVEVDHVQQPDKNPFAILKSHWQAYSCDTVPGLPPFQGGVAGYFAYDLCQHLEAIPPAEDSLQFPDMLLGFYDVVVAFDHQTQSAFVFSQGWPEQDRHKRQQRAEQRLNAVLTQLASKPLAPQAIPKVAIQQPLSASAYEQRVQKAIDHIYAGDIFEVNLSQRFLAELPLEYPKFALYQALRQHNPAPFSGYFHVGDVTIASASPERFLQVNQGRVQAKPIKGTRPRGATLQEDAALADALLASEKDRAENIMIVDLLRNDLSRVCDYASVKVPQLCTLESYETVHHLVSTIVGELRPACDVIDLLCATFPGGSITGAPKVRAMEIIQSIEQVARGPYCGSMGYIGFDGSLDLSILIRTMAIKGQQLVFQGGGAVVIGSDPTAEYEETLVKVQALREVLS